MVGIGKWAGRVNTIVFKGEVTVDIREKDGEYDFNFEIPEKFKNIEIKYYDVHAQGNTIKGKGELSILPGKIIEAEATFDGDKMTGKIKLPFLGNKEIKIKDGHRVG